MHYPEQVNDKGNRSLTVFHIPIILIAKNMVINKSNLDGNSLCCDFCAHDNKLVLDDMFRKWMTLAVFTALDPVTTYTFIVQTVNA